MAHMIWLFGISVCSFFLPSLHQIGFQDQATQDTATGSNLFKVTNLISEKMDISFIAMAMTNTQDS